MPDYRSKISLLCKDAAILVAIALVAETVLQLAAPSYRRLLFDIEYTGSRPVEMNSRGYRGIQDKQGTPPAQFRVLALGDSVCFGTGLAVEDTWPALLEKYLQESVEEPVEVLNTGTPGMTLQEISLLYARESKALEPTVVVLGLTGQFVSRTWLGRDEVPRLKPSPYLEEGRRRGQHKANRILSVLKRRFCLPSFLTINAQRTSYWSGLAGHEMDPTAPAGPLVPFGWRQPNMAAELPDEMWEYTRLQLQYIKNTLNESGTHFVVIFHPLRFELSDSLMDNEKLIPKDRLVLDASARALQICNDLGIAYIDIAEPLKEYRRVNGFANPLYIPFDYIHLNETGSAIVSQAIGNFILDHHIPNRKG